MDKQGNAGGSQQPELPSQQQNHEMSEEQNGGAIGNEEFGNNDNGHCWRSHGEENDDNSPAEIEVTNELLNNTEAKTEKDEDTQQNKTGCNKKK